MDWIIDKDQDIAPLSDGAEIVANFWYLIDEEGFIYSLRIKLYVCDGTEDEKLTFLKSRAYCDYLIARPFSIPDRFGTRFVGNDGTETKFPVIHHRGAVVLGGVDHLFWDGVDQMQRDLPAQTRLTISQSPCVKVTALVQDANGNIVPFDTIRHDGD
jgi:hypothetical protein